MVEEEEEEERPKEDGFRTPSSSTPSEGTPALGKDHPRKVLLTKPLPQEGGKRTKSLSGRRLLGGRGRVPSARGRLGLRDAAEVGSVSSAGEEERGGEGVAEEGRRGRKPDEGIRAWSKRR